MKQIIGGILFIGCAAIYFTRWYFIGRKCYCKRKFKNNELIIITGATSGIGLALAEELASRGASLLLGCRDTEKAKIICKKLIEKTKNPNIQSEYLDLQSFESVKDFTNYIIDSNLTPYALVNNAGIFYANSTLTKNKFDITFQTNYASTFLLTLLLLPVLTKHPGKNRIVNLSSDAHLLSNRFPQPEFHKKFDDTHVNRMKSYAYSKFCLVLFSQKLERILKNRNKISVHCVDPGNCETNIFRNFPLLSNFWWNLLQKPIRALLMKTPLEGAQSVLHCLLSDEIPPFYVKNLNEYQNIHYRTFDPILSDTLWSMSRKTCSKYLVNVI